MEKLKDVCFLLFWIGLSSLSRASQKEKSKPLILVGSIVWAVPAETRLLHRGTMSWKHPKRDWGLKIWNQIKSQVVQDIILWVWLFWLSHVPWLLECGGSRRPTPLGSVAMSATLPRPCSPVPWHLKTADVWQEKSAWECLGYFLSYDVYLP